MRTPIQRFGRCTKAALDWLIGDAVGDKVAREADIDEDVDGVADDVDVDEMVEHKLEFADTMMFWGVTCALSFWEFW